MVGTRSPADEVDRIEKIADQQATAHSFLHNRYHFWYMFNNVVCLVLSTLLLMLNLASDQSIKEVLHLSPDQFKWAVGLFAAIVLILTLVELLWRPSEKSQAHETALKLNSDTKDEIRKLKSSGTLITQQDFEHIQEIHQRVKNGPKIPESMFISLKARHHRKVQISKAIDKYPGTPIWLLKIRYLFKDSLGFWKDAAK